VSAHSIVLSQNLACLENARRNKRRHVRTDTAAADKTLQTLAADLLAARAASCMTQSDVAARMGTTKSAVSRLERGVGAHPTLRTITRYALAVDAAIEIRVRTRR